MAGVIVKKKCISSVTTFDDGTCHTSGDCIQWVSEVSELPSDLSSEPDVTPVQGIDIPPVRMRLDATGGRGHARRGHARRGGHAQGPNGAFFANKQVAGPSFGSPSLDCLAYCTPVLAIQGSGVTARGAAGVIANTDTPLMPGV